MAPALRALAALVVGVVLLAGCGEDEPSPRTADDPTTSRAPTSSTELPTSTETPAEDPVSVTLYDADFTVSPAGDLTVVETLTLDVPVDDRHGIYRDFEDHAIEDFEATLDGADTPVSDSIENGMRRFRIGDPDRTLSVGEHVVRMEYGVAGVLTPDAGSGGQRFDWQLIPSGWGLDIDVAELTVELPAAATDVVCTVGRTGPCDLSGTGTTTLVVSAADLDDHTPVLLQAAVPLPADA